MCFDFLYKSGCKISNSKKKWARYNQECIMVSLQSTRYSSQILTKLFLHRFSKNTQTPNFTRIRPVKAQLLHADRWVNGRTNMTKLTVASRNFANAPKNSCQLKWGSLKEDAAFEGGMYHSCVTKERKSSSKKVTLTVSTNGYISYRHAYTRPETTLILHGTLIWNYYLQLSPTGSSLLCGYTHAY